MGHSCAVSFTSLKQKTRRLSPTLADTCDAINVTAQAKKEKRRASYAKMRIKRQRRKQTSHAKPPMVLCVEVVTTAPQY